MERHALAALGSVATLSLTQAFHARMCAVGCGRPAHHSGPMAINNNSLFSLPKKVCLCVPIKFGCSCQVVLLSRAQLHCRHATAILWAASDPPRLFGVRCSAVGSMGTSPHHQHRPFCRGSIARTNLPHLPFPKAKRASSNKTATARVQIPMPKHYTGRGLFPARLAPPKRRFP